MPAMDMEAFESKAHPPEHPPLQWTFAHAAHATDRTAARPQRRSR